MPPMLSPVVGAVERESEEIFARSKVLHLLREHGGVDFSRYRASALEPHFRRRLLVTGLATLPVYADFLPGNAAEMDALEAEFTSGQPIFFQDPEAFEALRRKAFRKLVELRGRDDPVRIWVIGCSTGQEAYSLAMLGAEALGELAAGPKLQVFATDLSETLLDAARSGLYPKSIADEVTPERLRRFFVQEAGGYRVCNSLRQQVVFARQNLLSDPPFSRLDLISCRNLLALFEPSLQDVVLPSLHYALEPGGFLFLGAQEVIKRLPALFAPVDRKWNIHRRKSVLTPPLRLPVRNGAAERARKPGRNGSGLNEGRDLPCQREADRIVLTHFSPPGVLIDAGAQVLQFRGATGAHLEMPSGIASFDLFQLAREGLLLPLRAALNKARRDDRSVCREGVLVRSPQGIRPTTLHVIPLHQLATKYFLVLFQDPGPNLEAAAAEPLASGARPGATSRLTALELELAETREFLRTIQDQNVAATEELQAAGEEMQSANEELQSMNEEFQTSKEELESTNEELKNINDELAARNTELSSLNADVYNLQLSLNTAILLLSRDLKIRRFTPAAERIFNLLPTDVGRSFGAIRHSLDVPDLEELLAGVIATMTVCEREVQDRDGRWYELQARPYLSLDRSIDGVVLGLSDIDALKRGEEVIKAARDYAEATLRTMPVPFLILRADLRVNSASDAFYETFGVTPAASEGRLIYELGNRQWDIPRLRELLEEILPQKNFFSGYEVTHDFESLGRRNMLLNARRLNTADGSPERILLAIEDITARRRIESAVRESEERFRTMADNIAQLAWMADAEGSIVWYNRRWFEFTGTDLAEMIGWGWEKVHHPDHLVRVREKLMRHWASGEIWEDTFPLRSKDGEYRWFLSRAIPIRDAEGKVQRWFGTNTDVTDQRAGADALARAKEEAEAASRAKDDFLAALSHELRTPLTPVLMTAAALESDPALAPDIREQLGMMRRNIELEARLIDDLLDLTRISRGKLQIAPIAADLHQLLQHTAEIVRSDGLGKQVRIVFELAAERHFAQADPTRLQQVFWNLIKNSLKFTPTGGTITVRTRNDVEGWIQITVEDTGIGISEDMLPHIFNAFEQGRAAGQHRYGGLGLGLAISRAIVEVHGGLIRAASDGPGRGAAFTVSLATVDAPKSVSRTRPAQTAPLRSLRLLVVEDHETTRTVLARLLGLRGHRVVTAGSIAEAMAAFEEHPFDAVISDLGLPDGSGLDLMKEFQRQRPIPGIALSGYGMEDDLRRSKEVGFFAHLVKPVDLDQLRLLLDQLELGAA